LAYLGYGRLSTTTFVAPYAVEEVETILSETGVAYERFSAAHIGGGHHEDVRGLVRLAWDLTELGEAYGSFVRTQTEQMCLPDTAPDPQVYSARFHLVHAWRSFLFRDPQLPAVLLPDPWPGTTAAAFFDHHEARLRPGADRFVDACLSL
jgi:phenylacetic acid degradation operon negative regulatory protein